MNPKRQHCLLLLCVLDKLASSFKAELEVLEKEGTPKDTNQRRRLADAVGDGEIWVQGKGVGLLSSTT